MPRSRTEAMLSGCCVLTSGYHDANLFIEHGVNGFIMPDNPLSYAEAIYHLINYNYRDAVKMGEKARETAIKYFNPERYQKDLYYIISEVAKGNKPVWDCNTIYDKKIDWTGERVKAGGKNES
jgi:glycosyltransferase involved in cell wall biosynthesis